MKAIITKLQDSMNKELDLNLRRLLAQSKKNQTKNVTDEKDSITIIN